MLRRYMQSVTNMDEAYEELREDFTKLFLDPFKPKLYPYESMCIDGWMISQSLLRVKSFLRKAKLRKADSYPEPEDHIAFELGVMRYPAKRS